MVCDSRNAEMNDQPEIKTLRLRPHHISCIPFLNFDGDRLDREFFQLLTKVKGLLTSDLDLTVTVVEGVDDVCQACPSRVGDRCESAPIKEDMVRRLDIFLLKNLGKSYGETLEVSQWRSVISQKWPYHLCRVCRWRTYCSAQVT